MSKVFQCGPSWLRHAERSNTAGHIASQSPAISRQTPREFREISIIHLMSRLMPRNLSEPLGRSMQKRSGSSSRAPKIDLKLVAGPSWDATAQPRASRERLGASPVCPRKTPRVAKDAPGRQKEGLEAPGSTSRRPESTTSRVRE